MQRANQLLEGPFETSLNADVEPTAMKRILLFALIVISNGSAFADTVNYVESGNKKLEQGDLDGALADYNMAIDLKSHLSAAFVGRGNVENDRGDKDAALADYTRAIESQPDNAIAYFNRGNLKHFMGDDDGASMDLNKSIQLKPDYLFARMNRGFLEMKRRDLDGAMVDFEKAIELKPDLARGYGARGVVKMQKDDFDGAMTDFNKAISLDPRDGVLYKDRGCLNFDYRKFTDALSDFRKCAELTPAPDYARFRIWIIRSRSGEQDAASKELQQYIDNRQKGTPDDWQAKVGAFLTGKLSEREFLKAAGTDSGHNCEAYFYAGSKRLIAGDETTAEDFFNRCVATNAADFTEYTSAKSELKFLHTSKRAAGKADTK